jgi:hypothetical protein
VTLDQVLMICALIATMVASMLGLRAATIEIRDNLEIFMLDLQWQGRCAGWAAVANAIAAAMLIYLIAASFDLRDSNLPRERATQGIDPLRNRHQEEIGPSRNLVRCSLEGHRPFDECPVAIDDRSQSKRAFIFDRPWWISA